MQKTEESLSHSKYAEHLNVTEGYIARLIKEGRLHLIKGKLNVEMREAAEKQQEEEEARKKAMDMLEYEETEYWKKKAREN